MHVCLGSEGEEEDEDNSDSDNDDKANMMKSLLDGERQQLHCGLSRGE